MDAGPAAPAAVPEPSTVFMGLTGAVFGLSAWKRRRATAAA
jgi:hypothetical protein